MKKLLSLLLLSSLIVKTGKAQDTVKPTITKAVDAIVAKVEEKKSHWYDKINIRGYMQVRYNRILESNPEFKSEQGDKSIGANNGFFIRRMRIIFFGQLNEHVYFYVQPDFASSASSTSLHFGQLRDAYFDVSIDKKREFRFRIGQSKVPYGFENMQSSQNRLPLDRNEPFNSAVSNERDLGVYFMYAPKKVRELYSSLVSDGYKGCGDYGVFAFGLYNGQTANKPELNNNSHWAARLTYPFKIKNQIIEPGISMYSGIFTIPKDQLTTGVKTQTKNDYLDERYAAQLVLYPKPFGVFAEYTIGKGPAYDLISDSVLVKDLSGGYITLTYMLKIKKHIIMPFVRGQIYDGAKKHELDSRAYEVKEIEGGIEWQPMKYFEFTATWLYSEKWTSDKAKKDNFQIGNMLRLQAQVNF